MKQAYQYLSQIFYELSKNYEIQNKLRDEFLNYWKENDEISYETVAKTSQLPYLDKVVNEALRVIIMGPAFDRVCLKSDGYSLEPFSNFKIPFGISVFAPSYALVHDEKYFDHPFTFNPYRVVKDFPSEGLGFEIGARSCIGEKFSIIVLKTAVLRVLKNFKVSKCENTPENLTVNRRAFILQQQKLANKYNVEFI